MVQGMHLLSNTTTILTSPPSGRDAAALGEFWKWLMQGLDLGQTRVLQGKTSTGMYAKRLIYSCRCPFIHPFLLMRWREIALGLEAGAVPMAQRKVVLYFSRSQKDAAMSNGGRRVLNEEELLRAVRGLLQRRGQNESLVVFQRSTFGAYRDLARYINTTQVRAMLGPHGGAFMNVQFATKDTLVVEFQHGAHVNQMVWENGTPLRVNYWLSICEPVYGSGIPDMRVDVQSVVQLLARELGKEYPADHFVAPHYQWRKAEVEGSRS